MGVAPDSPANIAGLQQGDIIISLNQQQVSGIDDIHRLLTRDVIGRQMPVVILKNFTTRDEKTITPIISPDLSNIGDNFQLCRWVS
jgi:S1-C subfamily serine protease